MRKLGVSIIGAHPENYSVTDQIRLFSKVGFDCVFIGTGANTPIDEVKHIAKTQGFALDYFNLKALIGIFLGFSALSFTATALYELPVIRWCIIGAVLLALIIFHKKVIAFVKSVLVRK